MAKTIEVFRKCCLDLLKLTEIRENFNFDEFFSIRIKGEKYLYYQPEYRKKINELVDYFLKEVNQNATNYSKEYLLKSIDEFIFNLKFDKEPNKAMKIDEYFNSLTTLLKKDTTYIVTRQIVYLSLDSELSIGKVTFFPYSREKHEKIYRDVGVKTEDISNFMHKENDEYVGCIAKVEISAPDQYKALELSSSLIEESLDLIRFYFGNADFGLRGTLTSLQTYATMCNDTKNMCSTLRNNDIRDTVNLKVSWFESLRSNYGLTNIDNILKKDDLNRTDMEENLITSIKWFSEIYKHKYSPDNIIRLFISAETLLLGINEVKKQNLAEKLALINYTDERKRNDIYSFVKEKYEERSKLVHNGVSDYNKSDFIELSKELRLCIINIAKVIDKYRKFSDWENLIRKAKFSCKLEFQ